MQRKRRTLMLLGFLVTLVSTLLSGVFIHRSELDRADLVEKISDIRDVRAAAQAEFTESGAKIDSASVLFALAQSPSLESGARAHMIQMCKQAIEGALCFKHSAVRRLQEVLSDPPESRVTDCAAHSRTLEDFLSISQGKIKSYEQLLVANSYYVDAWQTELDRSRRELTALQKSLSREETWSSLLRSVGTALGLLGLIIVLARDLLD